MTLRNVRGGQAFDISVALTAIAAFVLALRVYARFFLLKHRAIEEYVIITAMICSIGFTACIGLQVRWGMGRHISEIVQGDAQRSLKAFYVSLLTYNISLGCTKTSIVIQYLRIFPTRKFQIVGKVTLAIVVSYTLFTIFASIFICLPPRAFWTGEAAKCVNRFAMWFTHAAMNIVTDFAIIILPMPIIGSLNLRRRQKQALIGIFALGGFVCLVSILRLKSLVAVSKSTDLTYDNAPAAMWSSVEVNIGIISACLPTLRPFAARYISSFASRSDTSQPTLGQWQRQHDQQSQRNIDLPTRNSQHKSNITVVHDFVVTSSKSDLNEIDDNGSDEVHILPQRSESRLC